MSSTHGSLFIPSSPHSPHSSTYDTSYYWEATTPTSTEAPDPRSTFGYVDLTLDTPAPPSRRPSRTPDHMSHFSNRPWANETFSPPRRLASVVEDVEGVRAKRRRLSNSGRRANSGQGPTGLRGLLVKDEEGMKREGSVEQVDLREVEDEDAVGKVLEKKRVDAINLAKAESGKATNFNSITCVICMEEMTNVTATHCGHIFCHTCLMEALIAGENQGPEPGKGPSRCPICRKKVVRPKEGKDSKNVVPLELKFVKRPRVATVSPKTVKGKEKAESSSSGKGKVRAD